jgi:ABC-type oligopeptide transport system substrate-binding subunit
MQLAAMAPALGLRPLAATADDQVFVHGLTLFESLKYPADFKQFAYVNAAAPKGGRLRLGALGSFDSLNAFVVRGVAPDALQRFVLQSLLYRSPDEPFSAYGLLATPRSPTASSTRRSTTATR